MSAVPRLRLRRGTVNRAPPLYKVSVLGLYSVGKSSLCRRFATNEFELGEPATVIVDYVVGSVEAHDRTVRLSVFDTAGQERFGDIVQMMLHDIAGSLVVYALNSRESFEQAKTYVQRIRALNPTVPIVLVGNKLDLVAPAECSDTGGARADDTAPQSGETPPPSPESLARRARVELGAAGAAASFGDIIRTRSRDAAADDDDAGYGSVTDMHAGAGPVVGVPPGGGGPRRRAVSRREARLYARDTGLAYVETSAMHNTRVTGAFRLLAEKIVAQLYATALSPETATALYPDDGGGGDDDGDGGGGGGPSAFSAYATVRIEAPARPAHETNAELDDIERSLHGALAQPRRCCALQ